MMHRLTRRSVGLSLASVTFALLGASCSKKTEPAPETTTAPVASSVKAAAPETVTSQGSGASFPAPVYSRWFHEFSSKNPGIRVNYQATGSGAGIKAFIAS